MVRSGWRHRRDRLAGEPDVDRQVRGGRNKHFARERPLYGHLPELGNGRVERQYRRFGRLVRQPRLCRFHDLLLPAYRVPRPRYLRRMAVRTAQGLSLPPAGGDAVRGIRQYDRQGASNLPLRNPHLPALPHGYGRLDDPHGEYRSAVRRLIESQGARSGYDRLFGLPEKHLSHRVPRATRGSTPRRAICSSSTVRRVTA